MNLKLALFSLIPVLMTCISVPGQTVHFHRRAAQVHDTVIQTTRCELNAERTIRQHQQLVDSSKQQLLRSQHRQVTILDIDQGTAIRARISYEQAATRVVTDKDRKIDTQQPVAGNTYVVLRHGDELTITRENGEAISEEEDKLLRVQLETFGRPNPLACFLHGKQLAVGDTLTVPEDVATELLGLTGNQGKTDPLVLKLTGIQPSGGIPCAVFETRLRTHSDESSLTLLMKGQIVIDPATCRTHTVELQGPVAISELRGPTVGRFTVSTNGTLHVLISNQHPARLASVPR